MPKAKAIPAESFFHHLDRLPEKEELLEMLRGLFCNIASFYGFEKISYSLLDDARAYHALLKAGMTGERQPIVLKSGKGDDMIVRSSAVLSALRSYRSHKMNDFSQPVKVFCAGESFFAVPRQDQPIQRRDEASLIMMGEQGPIAEAQIVQVLWKSLLDMGVPADRMSLVVNAIGCNQCFSHFRSSLSSHLRNKVVGLCKNCKRNFKQTPTRILVCEEEKCSIAASNAPQILDNLCEHCKKHLRGFLEFLDEMGISYHIDARHFRPGFWADTILFEFVVAARPAVLAPLTDTVSEGVSMSDVAPDAIAAIAATSVDIAAPAIVTAPSSKRGRIIAEGGRLSRAADLMGAKGLEAAAGSLLLDIIEQVTDTAPVFEIKSDVYLAQLGEMARRRSLRVLEMLRLAGITVKESLGRDAIKSQLKLAEKFGAPIALILGQKEALDNTIIVRETDSGIQEIVPQEKLIDFLKRRLKKV